MEYDSDEHNDGQIIKHSHRELRLEIEIHFDKIINHLDVDTETIHLRLDEFNNNSKNQQLIKDRLNKERANLIETVNNFKQKIIDKSSVYAKKIQRYADEDLFSECCFYLDSETLDQYRLDNDTIGLLVFTDFYVSFNEWDEIKTQFLKKEPVQELKLAENRVLKHLCIMNEIKRAIINKQTTVNIYSIIFETVKSITTQSPRICELEDSKNCFKNLYMIDLEEADLSHSEIDSKYTEPRYLFPLENLKELKLKKCTLKEMGTREVIFASKKLEQLDIYGCIITIPNDTIFMNLKELKSFTLKNSNLKYSSRNGIFSGLSQLKSLHLESPLKTRIQLAHIDHLKNLEELSLIFCNIEGYPSNIMEFYEFLSNLGSLKTFNLDGAIDLEAYLSKPISLKNLKISWLKISNNNLNIFKNLQELEALKLDKFSFVSDSDNFNEVIKDLTSLNSLTVEFQHTYGEVDRRPKAARDIFTSLNIKLDKIGLFNVNLECLNELKINQINLQEINLKACSLKSISNSIFKGIVNLKILNLSLNKIEHVSNDAFQDLSNLAELYLFGNRINQINAHLLSPLIKLEKLIFSLNDVEHIDINGFRSLENLKVLDLGQNNIDKLERLHLKYLSNLEYLYLSRNSIELVDGLFEDLKKIKEIDVCSNKIANIDLSYFINGFSYLERLYLNGNDNIKQVDEKLLFYLVNTKGIDIDLRWIPSLTEQLNMCEDLYRIN